MYPMQYDVCTNTEEAKRPSRIDRRDLDRLASLGQLAPICGGLVIPKAAECHAPLWPKSIWNSGHIANREASLQLNTQDV
jgi:hypothetical protein